MPIRRLTANEKSFALLSQHFYPEMVSTGMHMTELATRLAEYGWRINAFAARAVWGSEWGERPIPREITHENVRISRVGTLGEHRGTLISRGIFAVSFSLSVCWALWRRRGDYNAIVITTTPPFLGVIGWLFSRLLQKPYLLIVYDVYPDVVVQLDVASARSLFVKCWEQMSRLMLNSAAVIVVIGRDMAQLIARKLSEDALERVVLIPNWSDERHVRPVPREENDFLRRNQLTGRFVVQYAGRFGRTHNVEPLVHAAKLLAETDVVFQFIGDGAKKGMLETLAEDIGSDNVQFLPYQRMDDLAQMLSAADIAIVCLENAFTGLVVPSKSYGILASGTPIVGVLDPDGEIGRMINETGCGIVVAPDPESIAGAISDLMRDPARRQAMGDAGREAFLRDYTLEQAARAYDAVLSRMLELAV